MRALQFTDEELEVLREILQHEIEEIDIEVFRTDTHDFKDMLKHRRGVLQQIVEKIPAALVAP